MLSWGEQAKARAWTDLLQSRTAKVCSCSFAGETLEDSVYRWRAQRRGCRSPAVFHLDDVVSHLKSSLSAQNLYIFGPELHVGARGGRVAAQMAARLERLINTNANIPSRQRASRYRDLHLICVAWQATWLLRTSKRTSKATFKHLQCFWLLFKKCFE